VFWTFVVKFWEAAVKECLQEQIHPLSEMLIREIMSGQIPHFFFCNVHVLAYAWLKNSPYGNKFVRKYFASHSKSRL
jgi:hypothetical protein